MSKTNLDAAKEAFMAIVRDHGERQVYPELQPRADWNDYRPDIREGEPARLLRMAHESLALILASLERAERARRDCRSEEMTVLLNEALREASEAVLRTEYLFQVRR